MTTEKNILFITSRNVINTCGELRLIKNRAIALYNEYGIKTDFIVFSNKKRNNKENEKIEINGTMTIFKYSINNIPGAINTFRLLRKHTIDLLKENNYETIILSGIFVLSTAKYFKKHYPHLKIIADIHGAFEEFIEFKQRNFIENLINRLIYIYAIREQKRSYKYCDGAFVVSQALKKYVINRFNADNLHFIVVPCSTSQHINTLSNALAMREKWRNELGINDHELLFIYSGGISVWQSIDDANNVFKMLREKMPKMEMHFLIMSFDVKNLQYLTSKNTTIRSFSPNEVQNVLYAGDYAFLLRGNHITNNVAFPNKFFEYVLSGMQIICTPFVHDIEFYVRTYNLGITIESINSKELDKIVSNIETPSILQQDWFSRSQLVNELCFENTLKPFVSFIINNEKINAPAVEHKIM